VELSFFVNHTPPGRGPGPHRHPYPEVFVIQEGTGEFLVGDERVTAGAGQVIVVPAGVVHGFTAPCPGRLEMLSLHAAGEMRTEWVD
jgi:mannose-6-phosphate isomerase-like protein (cupin superfamily)